MKSRAGLFLLLTVLGVLFFVGTPSANEKAKEAALVASTKWLELVDKGNYTKSWERAAKLFRDMVTKLEWQMKLDTYRTPLGKVSERKLKSTQYTKALANAPEGEYVVIQYETVFKNEKTVFTETVTAVLEKDGKWKVAGYYITPPGQESQPSAEKKKE